MSQKVTRPRTIDHDFHATYAGKCPRCGERWETGTVIVKSVYGYQHAVCPRDLPDEHTHNEVPC